LVSRNGFTQSFQDNKVEKPGQRGGADYRYYSASGQQVHKKFVKESGACPIEKIYAGYGGDAGIRLGAARRVAFS